LIKLLTLILLSAIFAIFVYFSQPQLLMLAYLAAKYFRIDLKSGKSSSQVIKYVKNDDSASSLSKKHLHFFFSTNALISSSDLITQAHADCNLSFITADIFN